MNAPGRDNGLRAAGYALLAELPPSGADSLLAALADAGVAAYAQPDGTTDRVWVDEARTARARGVLIALMPGHPMAPLVDDDLDAAETDARFAEIVAGFERAAPTTRAWPDAEDVPAWQVGTGSAPMLPDAEPDDEGHFVPPDPPRGPRPRPITVVAVIVMLLGALLLWLPTIMGIGAGTSTQVIGILLELGGFATLVATMRTTRESTGDADDGAVL